MIYTSANRDETVFLRPQEFDIHRDPNPHLSFGTGEHFCLGIHLARLEGRVFFEELLARFPTIELAGEPRRQRSNLNNALKELPVTLTSRLLNPAHFVRGTLRVGVGTRTSRLGPAHAGRRGVTSGRSPGRRGRR